MVPPTPIGAFEPIAVAGDSAVSSREATSETLYWLRFGPEPKSAPPPEVAAPMMETTPIAAFEPIAVDGKDEPKSAPPPEVAAPMVETTPIAAFEPIAVDGKEVSPATLENLSEQEL